MSCKATSDAANDPDIAALQARDGGFVRRLVLLGLIIVLGGAWGILALGEANLGQRAADGFRALTQ